MKDKNSLFTLINKINPIDKESIKKAQIELDRKVLADIALNNPAEFAKLVEKVK